jgi:hypothetical protein
MKFIDCGCRACEAHRRAEKSARAKKDVQRSKPHIRLSMVTLFGRRWWICRVPSDDYIASGTGLTPKEAYTSWIRAREREAVY